MKTLLLCLFTFTGVSIIYAQHRVYVGGGMGAGYIHNKSNVTNPPLGCFSGELYNNAESILTTQYGIGSQANIYALYGYRNFRIGYRLEYMYVRPFVYTSVVFPSETERAGRYSAQLFPAAHFVSNSIILEVSIFRKKQFSISPTVSLGYSRKLGYSIGFENHYLLAGTGLQFGLDVKNVTLYLSPDYSLRFNKMLWRSNADDMNEQNINQSILLTLGIRGDVLAALKGKKKE